MADLNNEHKTFIVTCLGQFMTPSEVVVAVKEVFEVVVTRQQVHHYDVDHSKEVAKEWVKVFNAARKAFIKDTSSIAISHSAFRLRELNEIYRDAKKSKLAKSQRATLEQAAKESGGAYTNKVKQEVTGANGAPVRYELKPVDTDYRNAAAPLAPLPEGKTPPTPNAIAKATPSKRATKPKS